MGASYQFRGRDGQNGQNGRDGRDGSDANVPSYITQTKITSTTIESPTITGGTFYGGSFNVYPDISAYSGSSGVNVYTKYNGRLYNVFSVQGGSGDFPIASISSCNAVYFNCPVYFTQGANGVNVQATFA